MAIHEHVLTLQGKADKLREELRELRPILKELRGYMKAEAFIPGEVLSGVLEGLQEVKALQEDIQEDFLDWELEMTRTIEEAEALVEEAYGKPKRLADARAALEFCSHLRTDEASLQELVGGAGVFDVDYASAISEIRFSFGKNALTLTLTEEGRQKVLTAATDGSFACSEVDGVIYASTARWRAKRRLELEIRRRDAMSGVRLILSFEGDKLCFEADETLMTEGGLGMIERRLAGFTAREVLPA